MLELYNDCFDKVFNKYLEDLNNENKESNIYKIFLDGMNQEYLNNTSNARKVIDYIAGMTDDFILKEYKNNCVN